MARLLSGFALAAGLSVATLLLVMSSQAQTQSQIESDDSSATKAPAIRGAQDREPPSRTSAPRQTQFLPGPRLSRAVGPKMPSATSEEVAGPGERRGETRVSQYVRNVDGCPKLNIQIGLNATRRAGKVVTIGETIPLQR